MNEIDKFIEKIKIENEWRKKDFAYMKMISTKLEQEHKKYFLKSTIPMIYGHLEGFVVSTLKELIEFINMQNLNFKQVSINILVLSIGDKFNFLSGKQSFEQKCEFSDKFINIINKQNVFLNSKESINIKSNLNFKVLIEICKIFNFDTTKLDIKDKNKNYERDLNKLVGIRNAIAHTGGYEFENISDIQKYITLFDNLTEDFLIIIKGYLMDKKYLKEKS